MPINLHFCCVAPERYPTLCGSWAFATLLAALGWLIAVTPGVVRGCYWIGTPLPLDKVYRRALAEGRTPTVEELDAALYAALAGKKAWQIEIMRRKAEAFARRFGDAGIRPPVP